MHDYELIKSVSRIITQKKRWIRYGLDPLLKVVDKKLT